MIPPTVTPGHFVVLYALPHLVTIFSARNVTTHVLQTSGRMPQTLFLVSCALWPPSPNVPRSASGLSLPLVFLGRVFPSWQYCLAPLQVRNALKLAGLGVPRSGNMPEPCCTPQRFPLTQECDPIWSSII